MYSSSTAVIMFGHNGLSAVNAIGAQLRDPNSALVYRMSRLTRDGTAKPVSQNQIFRRERGQGNFSLVS